MSVQLGSKTIGKDHPCFITFEAGPTFEGIENAKQLISYAAEAGADAIKFQILDPDRLVADREMPFSYDILVDRETGETKTVSEPLYDILKRRTLEREEWRELKSFSYNLGLAFFATIGFEDQLEFLSEIGCDSVKIASADVNHFPLIRAAAKTGMCVQVDTGKSSLGEIESAVDIIRQEGNENIVIHQCPSGYPARVESVNLRVIQTLQQMFPYPVAFSDHTPGWEMDIAAVAMGAKLVEKTITLDRTTPSVEHIMSLEPDEMHAFVKSIRDIETAMGAPRRVLSDVEKEKRKGIRRSLYLAQPAKAGQKLAEADVMFRRPGYGISPDLYETMLDFEFSSDLPADHLVSFSDLIQTQQD